MASLAEIRARMGIIQEEKQKEDKPDPITYEQYKVWDQLKKPNKVSDVDVRIYHHSDKSLHNTLECPKCESEYMHHIGVELFNCEEDEPGEHIELYLKESYGWDMLNVKCPEHTVNSDMKNNPSKRRNGLSISFVCEECHHILHLGIAQHKGLTQLSWSFMNG